MKSVVVLGRRSCVDCEDTSSCRGASAHVEAARCYGDAAKAAHVQCARSLELRIAISWAKLLRSQNENEAARHRLEIVWSSFDEGRATLDGSEAMQLLVELRSAG